MIAFTSQLILVTAAVLSETSLVLSTKIGDQAYDYVRIRVLLQEALKLQFDLAKRDATA